MARSLLHIPWRMVKAVALTALVGVVLFFAATRTQVGRSELRQEIQRQFDDRFAGSLTIGALHGNLVNDLFASDIRVTDSSGRTVLTVDSLVARPRWLALFSQQLTFRSVTAINPQADLHRSAAGRWNLQDAFTRPARPDTAIRPLDFSLADLRIRNGRVRTTRDGPAPEPIASDWLFDYTQAQLDGLNAHVTVEWQPGDELIDLFNVSAMLPSHGVRLQQLQGQILGEPDHWSLNQVSVQFDATDLTLDADIPRQGERARLYDASEDVPLVLDASAQPLDFDEMRRLIPRLPLADAVQMKAEVSGPLSGLVIESLTVERDSAQVSLAGTVTGWPDQIDYQLDVSAERLTKANLLAVVPTVPIDEVGPLGAVTFSLYGTGVVPFASDTLSFRTATEFNVQSGAGSIAGTLDLARRPNQPVEYSGRVRADTLNVYPLLRRPIARTALNGSARFTGRGLTHTASTGEMDVTLASSWINGRALDSLSAQLRANQGQFTGNAQLWHPDDGYLRADAAIDFLQTRPAYYAMVSTERFNLGWVPTNEFPTTQLTGRLETRGSGLTWETAAGQLALEMDSSTVTYDSTLHYIPPHRSTLRLADRLSSEPRLELTGDVATVQVRGDVAFRPLWAVGNLWARSLSGAVRQEFNKPYNPPLASAAPAALSIDPGGGAAPLDVESTVRWRDRAQQALRAAGFTSGLTVETTFAVKRADVLEALLPIFPTLRTDLEGRVAMTAGADQMVLQSQISGRTFATSTIAADSVSIRLDASGTLQAPLAETFSADLDVQSATMQVGGLSLRAPRLTFDYMNRQAMLHAESEENGTTGPFRLSTTVDLLPDHNELNVYDVYFKAREYAWSTTEPSVIDTYADAFIVSGLHLESRHPESGRVQRVQVQGTFSSMPSDTLQATAESVLLQPFSELGGLQHAIGGSLNGTVALSGGWSSPRTTSDVTVDWLSFDRRLLGQLHLTTRYELGAPDVLVDASLRSADRTSPLANVPTYLPYRLRRAESNQIGLNGRVRVGTDAGSAVRAADPLDLSLTVDRADLFFFEYIFEDQITNVSGYLSGRGRIEGSFQRPRFSADLYAVDGQFELPQFNLQYDLEGPIAVDDEGIKLNGVSVRDPDDGMATVSGAVLFNEYAYFSFDLAASLQEMRIIDVEQSQDLPFYGSIAASGDVTLTGPLSGATLRSPNARTTSESELFIPVKEGELADESGFIIFADSTGQIPDLRTVTRRENILDERPQGEPSFLEALDLELNLLAPEGSTVNLVFDPLLGDVVTAVGSGRIQIQRQEGEFFTYGTLEVNSGEYLFTAGEVFVRRFLIDGGTITWDGDPTNAQLNLDASYRTRASTAGLAQNRQRQRIPVVIQLDITGRVASPRVDLSLAIDSRDRNTSFVGEALQNLFNQPDLATDDLATEYATSVLLTNTFLLTTSSVTNSQTAGASERLTDAGNQLAFNSVSQLVASQLNRYLGEALPNLDVNLGVQGEDPQDLDVIYGVALRLLDERLIIRGEGIYQGDEAQRRRAEGIEGEFVVEVRLSRNVSVEAFYRRTGDDLLNDQTLTSTTGAGLSYQTEFTTWRSFFQRLFDWFIPDSGDDEPVADSTTTQPNNQ